MIVEVGGLRYHLLAYGEDGSERPENGGRGSDAVVARLRRDPVTDVVVLSHGWFGDVPAARDQYDRWITTMLDQRLDRDALHRDRPGFEPLVVALHWPSLAWGDEHLVPDAADPVGALVDGYALALPSRAPTRDALRTIVESGLKEIEPITLPPAVRDAYEALDAQDPSGRQGVGAAPGDDAEDFDAEATYQAARLEAQVVDFGPGDGLGGLLLAPLRAMTFWRMKRRARRFGESGAATLLRRLQAAVEPGRDMRFHLMGHSFGCIVASASVAGPPGVAVATVDSLTLVQGALSLWSFCSAIPGMPGRSGYFRRLVEDYAITGPVVVTTSAHDRAVGSFYPLGAGVARQVDYGPGGLPRYGGLGTFGARGPLPTACDIVARPADAPCELHAGAIHNVDCTAVIAHGRGPAGAHSDICHPEIAHLVWSAIATAGQAKPSGGAR